jgi:hypothetical protein
MTEKDSSQPSQSIKFFDINDLSTYPLPTSTREPQALGFDGHEFRINGDVPPHITKALYELLDRGVKYEDVLEELRQYEVDDIEDDRKMKREVTETETVAKVGKES